MIAEFKKWLIRNEDTFSKVGLSVVDTYEKSDSLVITYETPTYICDVNVQESGQINVEILSQKSGNIDFCFYCMTKRTIDISLAMDFFLDFIKKNPI